MLKLSSFYTKIDRKKAFLLNIAFCLLAPMLAAQQTDTAALFIRSIFDEALLSQKDYQNLHALTTKIGGRLTGSAQGTEAEDFTFALIDSLDLGTPPKFQSCEVPLWERGDKEEVYALINDKKHNLRATSLGNSEGTDGVWIEGEVVEVHSLDTLEILGEAKLKDKIVFFNRPMDQTQINTFYAYSKAVDQRVFGPLVASKYGAKAAIVRSLAMQIDTFPHTGVTKFDSTGKFIPALAIATKDAEWLSSQLQTQQVKIALRNFCKNKGTGVARNVIGEWKGSEFPDEIIVVGGHLDSWDLAGGAHDDGAGCMQSIQALRILKTLGYKPKRTIRVVMFANEENGLGGGKRYAELSDKEGEFHLAAIESDAGGFSPRSFSCDSKKELFIDYYRNVVKWLPLLEPYGVNFIKGGSGADISPLKEQGGLLIGLRPDSQRYFDYHHTSADTIDAVNARELALGSAAMSALIYLIDNFGIK